MANKEPPNKAKLDQIVAEAHRNRVKRETGYRDQALKMYPWICGRCSREFTLATIQELTVHHRDHNHDNNPDDGSNWELLCLYCHDNEHARLVDAQGAMGSARPSGATDTTTATHKPFEALQALLKRKDIVHPFILSSYSAFLRANGDRYAARHLLYRFSIRLARFGLHV